MATQTTLIVFIAAALVSLVIAVIDKKTVNQDVLKELRRRINDYKNKADQARKDGKVADMQKYQQMMMQVSQQQMGMIFKRLMYTMVIVLPFFWFMGHTFGELVVNLENGNGLDEVPGSAVLEVVNGKIFVDGSEVIDRHVLINDQEYRLNFDANKNEVKIQEIVVNLPFSLPRFGDKLGWLGWYILSSMPASIFFRKLFGITQ